MDEVLLTAVSTVGFPIVAFFAMFYFCKETVDKNTSAISDLKEAILSLRVKD